MATAKQVHPINWWDFEKLEQKSFASDVSHTVQVKREPIPIIIVPGLLASRLYRGDPSKGTLGWDPDGGVSLVWNYENASPKERLEMLVGPHFDKNYLQVVGGRLQTYDPGQPMVKSAFESIKKMNLGVWEWARPPIRADDPNMRDLQAKLAIENGWAGMPLGFYDKLMIRMCQWSAPDPKSKLEPHQFFYYPVYCFAYNWSQSNGDSGGELKTFIQDVITRETKKAATTSDLPCRYAIVITHSMGGLVTRSAMKQGAASKVLGVIHMAQPVSGAPAAYHHIRAGQITPSWLNPKGHITSEVLGGDSASTAPIFARCQGPAELLPNKLYRTNKTSQPHTNTTAWLYRYGQGATTSPDKPTQALPGSGQTSTNAIYLNRTDFLGLAFVKDRILDGSGGASGAADSGTRLRPTRTQSADTSAVGILTSTVTSAMKFQDDLMDFCHPCTYVLYGREMKTFDEVDLDLQPTHWYLPNPSTGTGTDKDPADGNFYTIADPSGQGDGTVPESSALALGDSMLFPVDRSLHPNIPDKSNGNIVRIKRLLNDGSGPPDHATICNHTAAGDFAVQAVTELSLNYAQAVIGGKHKLKVPSTVTRRG